MVEAEAVDKRCKQAEKGNELDEGIETQGGLRARGQIQGDLSLTSSPIASVCGSILKGSSHPFSEISPHRGM